MQKISLIFLTALAAVAFVGCGAPAATPDTANIHTDGPAGSPTLETLRELENRAFEANKNNDGKFFEELLTEKYVMSESGKRHDKATVVKMIAEHKCDIKSYSFTDEKLTNVGAATAIISMKVTTDGACEGQKIPSPVISASLYIRNGAEWKGAWHGEVPVVDPKAPPPVKADDKKAAEPPAETGDKDADPKAANSTADGETAALAAIERSVWEGWMNRDARMLDALTARELAFVNIFGGYFTNRTDTLKDWTENPCEIKSVDVADASSVSVAGDTSILFHKGTANGTCFGQKVGPILGTSIYVKDGPAWKLAFTMNMPAA